ncbi:hypothetical protein HK101_001039 [Irineochytrium annulatum]|nr:hypothetical protein HK101_001039 [Irineochytrium annulatum]
MPPTPQLPPARNALLGPQEEAGSPRYKDRYFILKSLTVEDLMMAVECGVWATQRKNEPILNRAFLNSDNVYLIFSANKSGSFFGYARMASEIPGVGVGVQPGLHTSGGAEGEGSFMGGRQQGQGRWAPVTISKLGQPFRVEWIRIQRLVFAQTVHLRNSWYVHITQNLDLISTRNGGKPVRISRDGVEVRVLAFHIDQPAINTPHIKVEPTIGKRILEEFERAHRLELQHRHQPLQQTPQIQQYATLSLPREVRRLSHQPVDLQQSPSRDGNEGVDAFPSLMRPRAQVRVIER